jgi:hypothetical protein
MKPPRTCKVTVRLNQIGQDKIANGKQSSDPVAIRTSLVQGMVDQLVACELAQAAESNATVQALAPTATETMTSACAEERGISEG